jgi:hypothetical protein
MSLPRSFDELVAYLKERDLAAKVEPGRRVQYPYYAGVPYPTWPLSLELLAEAGGWSVIYHDHSSASYLVRAGCEDIAVARFLAEVADWVVTSEHVRQAVAEWQRHCVEEERRQAELRRGIHVVRLPNDGTFHNLV